MPLIIDSPNFDFVIVGPTGLRDGVVLRSSHSQNDLIGFANLVYQRKSSEIFNYNINAPRYFGAWSNLISFSNNPSNTNVENRQFYILLVWNEYSSTNNSIIQESMQVIFRDIAYDLYRTAFNNSLTVSELSNQVLWLVSPLLYVGNTLKQP